ncbi:Spherical Body Protein 2 truncated copy 8 (SBP2) [Babesia bovis T2Bo]|uniref:Spherical Body Protein 2 truncated copy 8 (SBP2) n=1 Tax=Babesia bovis TaxID=5865 RepID=A7ANS5_BABBO|nr:Spherical Body Protein 2 truncated copy 8 (SBP2) [Babesia bovis T2Bo]EDO08209.1 Spherical Body Protein 2 truncated copy 8 (SBP2) [Babesia bovis T2Bo]|eukprot:XP_001611777.1 Spherical Body Protein 2 truncated copy 8 (SBP2) [Babesia bovis T2Bo]
MELARRNNGFRKVAKWIAGALVVAGAASGNVLCDEVSEPQEAEVKSEINVNGEDKAMSNIENDDFEAIIGRLPHDPAAVAIVNSRGKSFTNQDIYGLIDHDIRLGLLSITLTEEEIPSVREGIVELRRQKLLDAISFFDQLLSELPAELAQEASKYSYLSELPEDLASALDKYVKALNDRIEKEQDKIREAEMKKMVAKWRKQRGRVDEEDEEEDEDDQPIKSKISAKKTRRSQQEEEEEDEDDQPIKSKISAKDQNPSENNHLKGKAPENEDKKPKSKPWYKFW